MKKTLVFLSLIWGMITLGLLLFIKFQRKIIKDSNEKLLKFKKYYQLYNIWIQNKSKGYSFAEKLISKGYNKIAIYGNGEIGCRLYDELKETEVQVIYFIDKIANDLDLTYDEGIPVISVNNMVNYDSNIDVIVITTINIMDEITELLKNTTTCNAISIEELI